MSNIDWEVVGKVAIGVIMSFVTGYATAILSGTDQTKALASGAVSAGTYYLGNRQEKKEFT